MLRKISFHGFKSFADPVEIDFSDGITAIIGPNGCGKSNIFDGIRWVLGETSAKSLRGGSMKDVIFSGCDTRKAKDFAEVTLVLDNSKSIFKKIESESVSVSRRAFRNGKSEYLINDEPARLKDVQDLFLDTGIGSNSYSMIGQEQTKKLLSTKLEERRAIFEEASGIVKLKQQKETTEKRLDEVSSNMTRLEDIIKEIEKQLFPLREQSVKAKQYNEISNELTTIEVQFLLHEFDNVHATLFNLNQTLKTAQLEFESKTADLDEMEKNLETLKENLKIQNENIFEGQTETATLKEETEKLNGLIKLTKERIENSHHQILDIESQLKEIEEKYSLSTDDFNKKQQRSDEIVSELELLEKKKLDTMDLISKLEAKRLELKADIEFSRKKTTEIYNELSQLNFEYDQTNKRENEIQSSIQAISERRASYIQEKTDVEADVQKFRTEYDSLNNAYHTSQDEIKSIQEFLRKTDSKIDELQSNSLSIENELVRKKSRLESLEQFLENNDGFFEGVKNVLQAKKEKKLSGIHGAVATLIQVEKGYENAIENLLQSASQHIVVENDTDAKTAVDFLKKNQFGRATFLPLNLAVDASLSKEELSLLKTAKGIYSALDFVKCEQKFSPIIHSLLGRTLVAENLDIAVSFMKQNKTRLRISTIEGEVVQLGSITGGNSKKQKTSIFTKQREVEELKVQTTGLIKEHEAIKKQLSSHQEKKKTKLDELEQIHSIFEDARDNLLEKQQLLEAEERKLLNIIEKIQDADVQLKESELSLTEIKKSSSKMSYTLKTKTEYHEKLSAELEELTKNEEETLAQLDQVHDEKTSILLSVQKVQEEAKALTEFLNSFNEGNDSVEQKITFLYKKKETEENKIKDLIKELEQYEEQHQQFSAKLQEHDRLIEHLRSENKEANDSITSFEASVKTIRSEKEKIEKHIQSNEVLLSKKETEKSNILSRLEETYDLLEENLTTIERLEIDLKDSKKQIESLKRKISSLGNINHTAIEECEKLEERYKTEKEQFDDVKTAKEDLQSLMKTVQEEMTERFVTTFNEIARHFEKTFVDLFGGGKAKLSLADAKHPLDSAIDIVAQPPGKKPQTIEILSGGEKNFTAVALIFAILSSKPSPFVYLDEVDAPLDDANVARYAYYLKQFSDRSQFIVVTHRKGTMQISDYLYGVTQEEQGVTIVFPHKLEDKEKKSG